MTPSPQPAAYKCRSANLALAVKTHKLLPKRAAKVRVEQEDMFSLKRVPSLRLKKRVSGFCQAFSLRQPALRGGAPSKNWIEVSRMQDYCRLGTAKVAIHHLNYISRHKYINKNYSLGILKAKKFKKKHVRTYNTLI